MENKVVIDLDLLSETELMFLASQSYAALRMDGEKSNFKGDLVGKNILKIYENIYTVCCDALKNKGVDIEQYFDNPVFECLFSSLSSFVVKKEEENDDDE